MIKIRQKILILLSLFIFLMPIQQIYVDAAVAGKVVNQAAKKIAKEAIKDTAVQMSFDMVINYKYEPKDGTKPKDGFEMICLPKDRSGSDCKKPVQVKKMTSSDKQALGQKVEEVLDKKIAGGIGATRWGKFLDWVVPIFAVGFGYAVIDYAINGDVSDLFDDVAWDALNDAGFVEDENDDIYVSTYPRLGWFVNGRNSKEATFNLSDPWVFDYTNVNGEKGQDNSVEVRWFSYVEVVRNNPRNGRPNIYRNEIINDDWDIIANYTDKETEMGLRLILAKSGVRIIDKNTGVEDTEVKDIEKWDQLNLPRTNSNGKQIPMVAPGGLPLEDLQTGETVIPHPQKDGTVDYRTETGRQVNEDDVIVKDPEIVENADGSSTVIKQPTGSNPKPDDSDNGTLPPDPNEPGTEIPPGDGCDVDLQLPRFGALFRSLSDTFPFSIPWDLKSGFDAIFSEMGSERPEWTFELSGEKIKIEIPKMVDDWMPFLHSLLLIIFDIGILYAIYRLIQGGGS